MHSANLHGDIVVYVVIVDMNCIQPTAYMGVLNQPKTMGCTTNNMTCLRYQKYRTVKGKMITNHNASKLGPLGLLDFQTDLSRCGFRLIYHCLSSIYGLFIPVAPLSSGKRAHPVRSTHY